MEWYMNYDFCADFGNRTNECFKQKFGGIKL